MLRQLFAALLLLIGSNSANAWGDKGHEVVGLIAWHYLSPAARNEFETLLQHDNSGLTATDFVSEANWADAYRDSDRDGSGLHYEQTRRWHYVNLNIANPDFTRACFDSVPLQLQKLQPRQKFQSQQNAGDGPAKSCVVDKVEQFALELKTAQTPAAERLLALQFLMHFVGDLHQPLHAIDNNDGGGNDTRVIASGLNEPTSLHSYWDYAVVHQLGRTPDTIARKLVAQTEPRLIDSWRRGTPREWALEAFAIARDTAYGKLPPADDNGIHALDGEYAAAAKIAAAQQLTKAGVRLAWLLEQSASPR